MWVHEETIETTATPEQVWKCFSDVEGWKKWNAGIESIKMHGPFAVGTTFTMQPPGEEPFTSSLGAVEANVGFTDETRLADVCVLVAHQIAKVASGVTEITYRTEVTGPQAAEFGPMVTADFPDVLKALKKLAESLP